MCAAGAIHRPAQCPQSFTYLAQPRRGREAELSAKELSSDCVEIEMYGSELLIENRSGRAKSYFVRRREIEPNGIASLYAGSRRLQWNAVGDHIEFKVDLTSGETMLLRLVSKPHKMWRTDARILPAARRQCCGDIFQKRAIITSCL